MRKTPKLLKVFLLDNVEGLGRRKEVVVVKNGYFRNYLLPMGKAEMATDGILKTLRKEEAEAEQKLKKEFEKIKNTLEEVLKEPMVFTRKSGPKGNVFGSVTPIQIKTVLESRLQRPLLKKAYKNISTLKSFGEHKFTLDVLDHEFEMTVRLEKEGV